jgi:hypothetical protein
LFLKGHFRGRAVEPATGISSHLSGGQFRRTAGLKSGSKSARSGDRRGVEKRPLKLREGEKGKAGVQGVGRSYGFMATKPE